MKNPCSENHRNWLSNCSPTGFQWFEKWQWLATLQSVAQDLAFVMFVPLLEK